MHNLYFSSQNVILKDKLGRTVRDVAVYDESRLTDFFLDLTLKGSPSDCEGAKKAMYRCLELWDAGERRISVSINDFGITIYPTEHIDPTDDMIHLGTRPANPAKEVQSVASKPVTKSPNAAKLYEELQQTVRKYPSLKEKA
jgi:hypothetical protein